MGWGWRRELSLMPPRRLQAGLRIASPYFVRWPKGSSRYGQGGMAFGYGSAAPEITGEMAFPVPHGAISPAQRFAMKVRRFMDEHGVEQAALSVVASTRF